MDGSVDRSMDRPIYRRIYIYIYIHIYISIYLLHLHICGASDEGDVLKLLKLTLGVRDTQIEI